MSEALKYTMFQRVLFPERSLGSDHQDNLDLKLSQVVRFRPSPETSLHSRIVIFDFETTGLDPKEDRIIEIGGVVLEGLKPCDEFSYLIDPQIPLPEASKKITGITDEMLQGQPTIEEVLPKFLHFIKDAILVAHNAEFDMAFLKNCCECMGIQLEWPCFCTLKLSRKLLPDLDSRSLDSLAVHYDLRFEARHRSVGDCKVTGSVLAKILTNEGRELQTWSDIQPYTVADK